MGYIHNLDFTDKGYVGSLEDIEASLVAVGFDKNAILCDPTISTGIGPNPYSAVYSIENGEEHGIFDGRVPTAHLFARPGNIKLADKGTIIFFNCNESILERVRGSLGLSAEH